MRMPFAVEKNEASNPVSLDATAALPHAVLRNVCPALLGGWLAGITFSFVWAALDIAIHPQQVPVAALIAVPWIVALGSLSFVLPVWLFLLIPLYLLVPPSWPLWRWPICTALGVLSGICIVAYFLSRPNVNPPVSIFSWYILASVMAALLAS